MSNLRKRNVSSARGNAGDPDPLFIEYPSKPPASLKKAGSISDKTELFLKGYTSFMDKGINQDRGLKLMQYTLWMVALYYKDRVVIRDSLKKLYNDLSFARYALRLFGLPTAIEASKTNSWSASSETRKGIHKFLGQILAWSMVGYYPLEHGAYLQWQTPKLFFQKTKPPPRLAEKLSAWSCRCWLVYIVAEISQCWLKLREESYLLRRNWKKTIESEDEEGDEKSAKLVVHRDMAAIRNLKLQILRNLLFTLPAIHWSLPHWDTNPWLPEPLVNSLMWLEAVVCMYQSIANFRQQ